MFVCSCKEKVRYSNGRVKLYWLVDSEGVYYFVTPVELKKRGLDDRILVHAVKGMLPKNRLGRILLKNLRVFKNNQHNMDSFNPREYKLKY